MSEMVCRQEIKVVDDHVMFVETFAAYTKVSSKLLPDVRFEGLKIKLILIKN